MSYPQWFLVEIAQGLRGLIPLSLDGQPAAELIGTAIDTWAADLYQETIPQSAVVGMFRELRRTCTRWPTIAQAAAILHVVKPQAHQPFALDWSRKPDNASLTAKAHATYNCGRLKLPVPAWCLPANDAEGSAILAMIEDIHRGEVQRAADLHRDHRERAGTQGANLARDTGAQPGSRDADPLATEGGDRDSGGDLERDELSDWRAGEAADWPFDDDAGADRAMEGIL